MKLKLFKHLTIAVISVLSLNFFITTPTFAANDPICNNSNISAEIKAANGCPGTNAPNLENIVTNIINAIIAVAGIVAVIFVLIGGFNYMTSTGDSGKVEKAKKTIIYALIGLTVCALSFIIVNFVIVRILKAAPTSSDPQDSDKGSLIIYEKSIAFLEK